MTSCSSPSPTDPHSATPAAEGSDRAKSKVGFPVILPVGVLGSVLFTMAGLLGKHWWLCDLCNHFRVHLTCGTALLTLVAVSDRRWFMFAIAGIVCLFNAATIWPLYRSPATSNINNSAHPAASLESPVSQPFRVVSLNLFSDNRQWDKIFDYLAQSDAEIVALQEVSAAAETRFHAARDVYPYQHLEPSDDNFGIGIVSRFPLRSVKTLFLGGSVPTLVAEVDVRGTAVTVIVAHPLPPVGSRNTHERNLLLDQIANVAAKRSGPRLIAGDLNTTSWSGCFDTLISTSGLRDSRAGFGVQPTWPSDRLWAGIPIDHALVSPDLTVLDRSIGPDIGSDHRPVRIELSLRTPSQPGGD